MRKNNEVSLYDFFNDMFSPSVSTMKSDVKENEKEYILDVELPGFKKEDINVDFNDGYLTVKASHKEEKKEDKDNKHRYLRQERRYSSVERSFYVGDINLEGVKAKLDNGILTIIVPKKELEAPKENSILIE